MAKKRITLPNNFKYLLEAGNIEALKEVYKTCDINAKNGRYGSNALEMTPLPREFAQWLVEQGADVNRKDHYGNPPIFTHASADNGDVQLLLDLGADVKGTEKDGMTPLHLAASHGRTEAMKALIQAGADVNAVSRDILGAGRDYTPLEKALIEGRIPVSEMLTVCEILLENGARITLKCKKAVKEIGEEFEFRKSGIEDKEFLQENTEALKKLYEVFQVKPVKAIEIHDGVSPIIIQETGFVKQYNKLWEYLVPPSGKAKTAQGEVIRIAGKVSYEILDNGGMNWDEDYQKMLDMLPQYFSMGNPLSTEELQKVKKLIQKLYHGNGEKEPELLAKYAVAWILKNQEVLPLLSTEYKR